MATTTAPYSAAYPDNWQHYNYVGRYDGDIYNRVLSNEPSKSSSSSKKNPKEPETAIGVSDYVFTVTCWGLKPNTQHSAFLLTTDVNEDCAPLVSNGTYNATHTYGDPLITNSQGTMVFHYHFKPDNSPYETRFATGINKNIAIIPVGPQLFKVSSADGTSWAQNYIESKGTAT